MTTAEIFAEHLALTPENAPWAFGRNIFCMKCDAYVGRASSPYCKACKAVGYVEERAYLTATSPLAEKPTPGWLEALVMCGLFASLSRTPCKFDFPDYFHCVTADDPSTPENTFMYGTFGYPTNAVALALLAADPDLRARCEAAEDWGTVGKLRGGA